MKRFLSLLSLLLLNSCGGPSKSAIIANTLQTLMANLIEANVTILLSDTLGPLSPVACIGGGTLQVDDAQFGTYDPGTGNTTIGPASVNFDHCVIKVCEGRQTILNGDGLFNIKFIANVQIGSSTVSDVKLVATSTGLLFGGEITGPQSFAYSLEGALTNKTFGGIVVGDGDNVSPLVYEGKTYHASELADLAAGC